MSVVATPGFLAAPRARRGRGPRPEALATSPEGAPVVPVVADSLAVFYDAEGKYQGGGFLLRDVCARAVLDSEARFKAAFAALRALHRAGFAHNDARTPNLLVSGSGAGAKLLWIDLRTTAASTLESAQRADGRMLAASMLGLQPGALPASVNDALAALRSGGGDKAYAALAAAVWTASLLIPVRA